MLGLAEEDSPGAEETLSAGTLAGVLGPSTSFSNLTGLAFPFRHQVKTFGEQIKILSSI